MTSTPEPPTNQSTRKALWIFTIVLAATAIGLNLFLFVRKPEPWMSAGRVLTPMGLILVAWSGLLPAASTGAKRTLLALAFVLILTGLVLAALDYYRA